MRTRVPAWLTACRWSGACIHTRLTYRGLNQLQAQPRTSDFTPPPPFCKPPLYGILRARCRVLQCAKHGYSIHGMYFMRDVLLNRNMANVTTEQVPPSFMTPSKYVYTGGTARLAFTRYNGEHVGIARVQSVGFLCAAQDAGILRLGPTPNQRDRHLCLVLYVKAKRPMASSVVCLVQYELA